MEKVKELFNKTKTYFQGFINKVGKDKLLHFVCSFLITIVFGLLFGGAIGLAAGLCAALLKETYDEYREDGTGWDWKDVLADVIGIITALILL